MAVSSSTAEVFLKEYIKKFCEQHPDIRLEIFKREEIDLIKQKQMDLVIDLERFFKDTDFKTIELFPGADIFVATKIFLKEHNISDTISLTDLLRFPIITRETAWQSFCKHNNLDHRMYPLAVSLSTFDLVYSIINKTNGIVYYVRELLNMTKDHDLVTLNVEGASYPPIKYLCGYTRSLSKPACTFIDGFVVFVEDNFLSKPEDEDT